MEENKQPENSNQPVEKIENKVTPPAQKPTPVRKTTVRKSRVPAASKVIAVPVVEDDKTISNDVSDIESIAEAPVEQPMKLSKKNIKKLKVLSEKIKDKEKKSKKKKKQKAKKEKAKKKLKEKKAKKAADKKKKSKRKSKKK
jgi:histone H1/5